MATIMKKTFEIKRVEGVEHTYWVEAHSEQEALDIYQHGEAALIATRSLGATSDATVRVRTCLHDGGYITNFETGEATCKVCSDILTTARRTK